MALKGKEKKEKAKERKQEWKKKEWNERIEKKGRKNGGKYEGIVNERKKTRIKMIWMRKEVEDERIKEQVMGKKIEGGMKMGGRNGTRRNMSSNNVEDEKSRSRE